MRTRKIQLRLTDEELAELQALAAEHGQTVSRFVRESALARGELSDEAREAMLGLLAVADVAATSLRSSLPPGHPTADSELEPLHEAARGVREWLTGRE